MPKDCERRKNPFLENKYNRNNPSECVDECLDDKNDIEDDDHLNPDSMTASYSEISFHTNYNTNSAQNINQKGLYENGDFCNHASTICNETKKTESPAIDDDKDKGPQRPASLVCDKGFPYNLEGTISKEGDMTHFVAENLEYKIKLSSPVTKRDSSQPDSSRNSTPSTSGLIPRQFLLPQQPPQIDSNVLNDIEIEAQYLAASVDNLTENLCNLLHSISSITADNVEIHKNAVNKLTDSMDANIKSMYTIMAKTEEISKSMKPTEQLANQIREIKRLVDMLEGTL